MPVFGGKPQPFKQVPQIDVRWPTFNGGWNNLFKPTELQPNELAQADNLMLIGRGTPTGRWGSILYHQAGDAGRVRLLDGYYNSLTSTNYLLAVTDTGYLTYKNNASYTIVTGASFASGYNYQSIELGNNTYFAAASLPFVKFDGSNLIPYTALGIPTNVSLAQLSAASGFNTYSWLITATSQVGETLVSAAHNLASLPLDLSLTSVKVSWNTVSAASGVLTGYNIYRGFPGNETYLASVPPSTTQYIDTGTDPSQVLQAPLTDTTGGPRAKYILKFDDRIVLAGLAGEPSKVLISGRYPYQDRFSAISGGGYIIVAPNDGDDITGLGIAGNQGMSSGGSAPPSAAILVYKNRSVHRVVLTTTQIGNFSVLDPTAQLLTSSNGCSSADTVVPVENDTFYFGTKGLFSVGQEPSFLNQIRTNELSARVREYVNSLSPTDFSEAAAGYLNYKYLLSFPTRRETIIYDRERACFMGPWKTPWGITKWLRYFDSSGTEKWLAGTDNTAQVKLFSPSYVSDSGTAIAKTLRTRKDDLGNWSIMKILKQLYVLFRNVRGSLNVNIRIEQRNGNTVVTKSFQVTSQLGNGGWGGDKWGDTQWGQTDAVIVLTGDELVRFTNLYKMCRVLQLEVTTTDSNANFEFLSTRFTAQGLGDQSLPATTRV